MVIGSELMEDTREDRIRQSQGRKSFNRRVMVVGEPMHNRRRRRKLGLIAEGEAKDMMLTGQQKSRYVGVT